jgi:Domain of unknown function (DUF1841)
MFNPTREQVRRFFFDAWRKYRDGAPLEGMETVAIEIAMLHPEYHPVLDAPDRHVDQDYTPEGGQTNPFLHMSLHMAVAEQIGIDQPAGIRAEFERIAAARGDRHEALHAVLECLGEVVWRAQRDQAPPDGEAYLECLRRAR